MDPGQWTVPRSAAGESLLEFLARALGLSRRRAKGLLDRHAVFVNDRRVWMARHALRAGDRVQVNLPAAAGAPREIAVLYRDDAVLVADKPPGVVSNGADSAEAMLRQSLGLPGLAAVHRLDRDTTGCLLLACDGAVRERLVEAFRGGAVAKVYRAIVVGVPTPPEGAFARPLDGKRARTEYQVMSAGALAAQVRIRIATGRTHQIRRHFADAGHPVAGDPVYATGALHAPALKAIPRQMLHAESLRFPHPGHGGTVEARAPLPADFTRALRGLGL